MAPPPSSPHRPTRLLWTGLLGALLIAGMWARSHGRYAAVEWTPGGGTQWSVAYYHDVVLLAAHRAPATGRAGFRTESGRADILTADGEIPIPPPVEVRKDASLTRITIAWWFILALHLTCWAAVMAWRSRRLRATVPSSKPVETHSRP